MNSSPCEVCVYYRAGRRCNKYGRISEDILDGDKYCESYNDGVDKTLSGYKSAVKAGDKILKTCEDRGLFTF